MAGKVNDRGNPDHPDRSAGEIDVEKEQYRLLDEVLIIPSVWKIENPTGYVLVGSFLSYSKLSIAYCASSLVNFSPYSEIN